jgi:hypothetical protein
MGSTAWFKRKEHSMSSSEMLDLPCGTDWLLADEWIIYILLRIPLRNARHQNVAVAVCMRFCTMRFSEEEKQRWRSNAVQVSFFLSAPWGQPGRRSFVVRVSKIQSSTHAKATYMQRTKHALKRKDAKQTYRTWRSLRIWAITVNPT